MTYLFLNFNKLEATVFLSYCHRHKLWFLKKANKGDLVKVNIEVTINLVCGVVVINKEASHSLNDSGSFIIS